MGFKKMKNEFSFADLVLYYLKTILVLYIQQFNWANLLLG